MVSAFARDRIAVAAIRAQGVFAKTVPTGEGAAAVVEAILPVRTGVAAGIIHAHSTDADLGVRAGQVSTRVLTAGLGERGGGAAHLRGLAGPTVDARIGNARAVVADAFLAAERWATKVVAVGLVLTRARGQTGRHTQLVLRADAALARADTLVLDADTFGQELPTRVQCT
jgi:hypothetical protein